MVDSFPDNPGEKLGSFVEGKEKLAKATMASISAWACGVNCQREQTAHINTLLANLIHSLGKAPTNTNCRAPEAKHLITETNPRPPIPVRASGPITDRPTGTISPSLSELCAFA